MVKYRKNFADYILDDYNEKIFVYLPGSKIKSASYDKFHDIGFTVGHQNYLTVKGFVRDTTANELIIKQLGLVAIGAKKVIVKNKDVSLFRLASRIVIKSEDYYVYNDAVGKKFQIQELDENYSEVTVFKKDV